MLDVEAAHQNSQEETWEFYGAFPLPHTSGPGSHGIKKCVPTRYFHLGPFCCIVSPGAAAEVSWGRHLRVGIRGVSGRKQEGAS